MILACRSTGGLDPRLHLQSRAEAEAQPGADQVRVTFLGTQGFLLERAGQAVLTAPLYSNPPLDRVLADGEVRADERLIDELLPTAWVRDVSAILVGHSHYDHLLDVPYIARSKASRAVVFGSRTMTHLIASAFTDRSRLRSVSSLVDYRMCPGQRSCQGDNAGQAGDWIPVAGDVRSGSAVRVRALCSEHSAQFVGLGPLWEGCLQQDRPELPSRARDWQLGDTLAWLVDFLQDGKPVFRVYYQDSATIPTRGYVHPELVAERSVDLALLCAGAFNQVTDNPAGILRNTQARYVLFGHWDDFFRPQSQPFHALPGYDFGPLVDRMSGAPGVPSYAGRFWVPAPGASFVCAARP
jgi:hypothetical protein